MSLSSSPRRSNQERFVCSWFWHEFLRATVLIVAAVEIARRVDGNGMDFEIAVRQVGRHHPGVAMLSRHIQFGETQRSQIGDPDAVFVDDEIERQLKTAPRLDEL